MHESGLARDLIEHAERVADGGPITGIRLRIGALAAVTPSRLRIQVEELVSTRWLMPVSVVIECGDDPTVQGAHSVSLVGVTVQR